VDREEVAIVGGGSTSASSVLLRRRYPMTGGLAVAGPCPTSSLIRSYPAEPEARYPQHATRSVAFSSTPPKPSEDNA